MADWIYVDNSNVFIEGKRVSAVTRGLAPDIYDAMNNKILDNEYRLSFGKLYEFVAGHDKTNTARAMLFGARPPAKDELWNSVERAGFELVLEDRNVANKEKKIDTGIVAAMMRDAYKNAKNDDTFKIVSGDSDYVPAILQMKEDGFTVDAVFWDHAANELKEAASNFISLNDHIDNLRFENN